MAVVSGTSIAAWLLVLGWLPMVVGVRRAGFGGRRSIDRDRPPDRDGEPAGDAAWRSPERGPRDGAEDRGPSASRRSGGFEPGVREPGRPGRLWLPLDVTLLLLTWLAGAGSTFFAVESVRRGPPAWRVWAGVALFLAGVAGWAWTRLLHGLDYAQLPRAPRALVTRGPYRVLRHPLYLATAGAGLGQLVAGASVECLLSWMFLAAILVVRSVREERLLSAAFGTAWRSYARDVPALLPTPRRR